MKKITNVYINPETDEDMVAIEISVDELDEDQTIMVKQAVAELTRYILRLKGIMSPECAGCSGC